MTIIDDLLVLLDDQEPRELERVSAALPGKTKQTLSSTLGRLVAKGWVERAPGRAKRQYRISKAGREHVTELLDQIKIRSERTWDGSWEQVVFNIPERDRKRRDELRKLLVELGYGRLHNSLWLSPWSNQSAIDGYVRETNSDRDITLLRTGPLELTMSRRIGELFEWDWESLERAYHSFVEEAQSFLKQRKRPALGARRIVYHYAKVLMTDPKLPSSLPVRAPTGHRAYELYQQVRPYCYQE